MSFKSAVKIIDTSKKKDPDCVVKIAVRKPAKVRCGNISFPDFHVFLKNPFKIIYSALYNNMIFNIRWFVAICGGNLDTYISL
jgi:hypothetical protein